MTATNKVSFTEKKVLYFKENFTFQSKCCIILNRQFYLSKRKYYNLKESAIIKQKVLLL